MGLLLSALLEVWWLCDMMRRLLSGVTGFGRKPRIVCKHFSIAQVAATFALVSLMTFVRAVLQLLLRVAVAKERARFTMNSRLHCSAAIA